MRKLITPTLILAMCFSGLVGGSIGSIFTQQIVYAKPGTNAIVAQSLNIVDKTGKSRIGIGLEDNNPVIYLTDSHGNVKTYWAISSRGPQFVFKEKTGKMNLFLESEDNRGASLSLMSGNGEPRVMLSCLYNKGALLSFFDENNSPRAVVSVAGGDSSVAVLKPNKKPAIAMLNRKGEGSILGIWNDKHEPAVSLAVKGDQPGLFMYQQPRTGLLFNTAGGRPALALMNNGTPVWSATGDVPPAPDMPLTDDLMRELLR